MLDDLRNSAVESYAEESAPSGESAPPPRRRSRNQESYFLGMTAPQRFIIAIMLFMMVCLLGSFCLILTDKVWLPFF
jgi:hypothetical protein